MCACDGVLHTCKPHTLMLTCNNTNRYQVICSLPSEMVLQPLLSGSECLASNVLGLLEPHPKAGQVGSPTLPTFTQGEVLGAKPHLPSLPPGAQSPPSPPPGALVRKCLRNWQPRADRSAFVYTDQGNLINSVWGLLIVPGRNSKQPNLELHF